MQKSDHASLEKIENQTLLDFAENTEFLEDFSKLIKNLFFLNLCGPIFPPYILIWTFATENEKIGPLRFVKNKFCPFLNNLGKNASFHER